jgi:hypothetical protein
VIAGQVHLFIVPAEDILQITEYYVLSNTGTETYVGREDAATGSRFTLAFPFPIKLVLFTSRGGRPRRTLLRGGKGGYRHSADLAGRGHVRGPLHV